MSIPVRLENDRSNEFANFLETKRKQEEDERRRQNILRASRSQAQAATRRAKTNRIDARRREMNVNAPGIPQFMRDKMDRREATRLAVAEGLPPPTPMVAPDSPQVAAPSTATPPTAAVDPATAPPAAPSGFGLGGLQNIPGITNYQSTLEDRALFADLEDRRNYTAEQMGLVDPHYYPGMYVSLTPRQERERLIEAYPTVASIERLAQDQADQDALEEEVIRILQGPDAGAPVDEEVIPANMMMSSYPDDAGPATAFTDSSRDEALINPTYGDPSVQGDFAVENPGLYDPSFLPSAFGVFGEALENILAGRPVNPLGPEDFGLPSFPGDREYEERREEIRRAKIEEEKDARVQELLRDYYPKATDPLGLKERGELWDAHRARQLRLLEDRMAGVTDADDSFFSDENKQREMDFEIQRGQALTDLLNSKDWKRHEFDELLGLVMTGDY